jgi:uncharacterized protein YndB with AHSA1/START domain
VAETKTIVIERVFDAPLERVWKAWTDPEMFVRWWGPKDFTTPAYKADFRVGGSFRASYHPDSNLDDEHTIGVGRGLGDGGLDRRQVSACP